MDITKAVAMRAKCVGIDLPFLKWVDESVDAVVDAVHQLSQELKTALWYTGSKTLKELRGKIRKV